MQARSIDESNDDTTCIEAELDLKFVTGQDMTVQKCETICKDSKHYAL